MSSIGKGLVNTTNGKFLINSATGKILGPGITGVPLTVGGSFPMANGDTLIVEGIPAGSDTLYYRTASGDQTSGFFSWTSDGYLEIQQSGGGWIGGWGTHIFHDGAKLIVYAVDPYIYGFDSRGYTGLTIDVKLEIQNGCWVQIR